MQSFQSLADSIIRETNNLNYETNETLQNIR